MFSFNMRSVFGLLSFAGGMYTHNKEEVHWVIVVWSHHGHTILRLIHLNYVNFFKVKSFPETKINCKYSGVICALYIYLYWKMVRDI